MRFFLPTPRGPRSPGFKGLNKDQTRVEHGTESVVTSLVIQGKHSSNEPDDGAPGVYSYINELSAIHYTFNAAVPHYTVQAGWIQALCLKRLGVLSDVSLLTLANGIKNASSMQDVKLAQSIAYGKTAVDSRRIRMFDNIHFYPTENGSVSVVEPNLETAFGTIQEALKKIGKIGKAVNSKDDLFLKKDRKNGKPSFSTELPNFSLKASEEPAWRRFETLLKVVNAGAAWNEKAEYELLVAAITI